MSESETSLPARSAAATHRAINWRQEYLHLAVALMTACWTAPWVALSLNWFLQISLPAALGLTGAHLLAGTLVVRALVRRRVAPNVALPGILLLSGAAAGLTLLLLPSLARAYGGGLLVYRGLFHLDAREAVPAGPIVIAWIVFLWWRGYHLGTVYVSVVRASFGLRLGLFSFLWVAIFAGRALREDLFALLPLFFLFGLLASSLARADSLSLDRSRQQSPFGRGWMLSLAGIALAVTLIAYLAALWFSGMNMAQAARVFGALVEGIVTLIFLLMSPVLLLAQVLYDFLKSVLPDQMPGTRLEFATDKGQPKGGSNSVLLSQLFTLLGNALFVVVILLVVLLVVAFVWFMFFARGERKEYDEEEREVLGAADVVGGLRRGLRERWRRLAEALGLLRQFGLGRDFLTALTIRRIYARMERLSGKRGYPRAASETPYEYRGALNQAFPGLSGEIQRIIEAYVAVRYGDLPEDEAVLQQVRGAWERLQTSPEPTP